MRKKYNWSGLQTLLLKHFRRTSLYIKDGTKTIRYEHWIRGNHELKIRYSKGKSGEHLLGIEIYRAYEGPMGLSLLAKVDMKTYSFGIDEIEKTPYIRWELNNGTGYRQVNFPK